MRAIFLFYIICFSSVLSFAQGWTSTQLETANTAKDIAVLTSVEKDAIKYINLARPYPQDFAKYEVEGYLGPAKYGDYLKNSPYVNRYCPI